MMLVHCVVFRRLPPLPPDDEGAAAGVLERGRAEGVLRVGRVQALHPRRLRAGVLRQRLLRDLVALLRQRDELHRAHKVVYVQVPLRALVGERPHLRELLARERRLGEELDGILAHEAAVVVRVRHGEPAAVLVREHVAHRLARSGPGGPPQSSFPGPGEAISGRDGAEERRDCCLLLAPVKIPPPRLRLRVCVELNFFRLEDPLQEGGKNDEAPCPLS